MGYDSHRILLYVDLRFKIGDAVMAKKLFGTFAAVALVLEAALAIGAPVALAQVDGDEKCSPDGYVMRYNSTLNQWFKGMSRCRGGGSEGGSRQNDGYRSQARNDDSGSDGQPEDGDEKCVGGKILKYHRYTYMKSGWSNTYRDC